MTIREILDALDREVAAARATADRLLAAKARIVATCREAQAQDAADLKQGDDPVCLKIGDRHAKPAARRRAA